VPYWDTGETRQWSVVPGQLLLSARARWSEAFVGTVAYCWRFNMPGTQWLKEYPRIQIQSATGNVDISRKWAGRSY
jgi:hypothetical protein